LSLLVWTAWNYTKSASAIQERWKEHVPAGSRRRSTIELPSREECRDPAETIEHIRVGFEKLFDIRDIVARARACPSAVGEDELHDVRSIDLLLFDVFGEDGMLLPAAVYAAALAAATRQALEALEPLAAHDPEVARLCHPLALLASYYRDYCPWAAALDLGWGRPAETLARWRDLLTTVRASARRMKRAKVLAGDLLPRWQAIADLLANQQVFLRLQLAVRVAVERDDPTCRHLCASRGLIAQIDAERVGLALRRRLHARSEAAILADKLDGRCRALLALPPAHPSLQAEALALAADCQAMLAVHRATPPAKGARQAILTLAEPIGRRAREMWSMLDRIPAGLRRREDEAVVEAAGKAAWTARDLSDGFYAPKQRKGLRTLLALREGDRLDDMLARR
jgi:hypothetical protein